MIWGESQLSELAFFVYIPSSQIIKGWRARVKPILIFLLNIKTRSEAFYL